MKLTNLPILIAASTILTACNTDSEPEVPYSDVPINFSATVPATRAGEFTSATLSSMGVFAYASGTGDYNENSTQLNYIYNVEISKTDAVWTPASPIYWPLNTTEKLTFFAYAPHTDKITAAGNTLSTPAFKSAGYPQLTYTNTCPDIDFLFAVPRANLTKAASTVNFHMMHALTKVSIDVSNSGIRTKKVTGLTLKAKRQGTFSYPPSGIFKYQVGEETITYGEAVSYSVELPGNDATPVENIQSYYVMPDRTGVVLTLTYTEYTGAPDTTGTEYTVVVSDTPDTDAGELPFGDNVQWIPGISIAYQFKLGDK